jgi:hypothetical protein
MTASAKRTRQAISVQASPQGPAFRVVPLSTQAVNPAPVQDMAGNSKGKEQAELDLAQRHLEMAGETQPTTRGEHLALAQVHLLKALCIGFGVGMDES